MATRGQAAPGSANTTYGIAAAAIMTAIVTVFTFAIQVPNPASGGYFNLSDIAVIFAAITFGPIVGLVAGGLGTAIADLLLGYAPFAPISFIAHGGEGLLAGYLLLKRPAWLVPAWALGVVWMMLAYFVGTTFLSGSAAALADLTTVNWVQALAGILGIPLYYAVRAAYPPITQMRLGRTWEEL
jgi:uncharacterized membrane protein